jgi:hypothetical protein
LIDPNFSLDHENIVLKNVLHEINLMGLEFIDLTKRGQAKEKKNHACKIASK